MKKYMVSFLAGALLLTGVTAFASSTSLVGQKVQGLFTVEQNGSKIADAVIINGTAYAPVRAVSEAAGVELKVEGKKIIMSEVTEPVATTPEPAPSASPTVKTSDNEAIISKLRSLESQCASLSTGIVLMKLQADKNPNDLANQQKLKDAQAKYDTLKAEYDQLKASSGL